MKPNRNLLKTAYREFNARNVDAVLSLMQPDVDWPNAMENRREIGKENVRRYWLEQWQKLDPHVEPVGFSDDREGRTVVDVHQVVKDLEGKVLVDQIVQHIYTIRDGLIQKMEIREPSAVPEEAAS
jgi:hypothetical protein